MVEILKLLKNKKVLYAENVAQIREGLIELYPQLSNRERTLLFSKAIHKILDKNLNEFNKETEYKLKQMLLKKVVTQQNVDLSAYDIIESYIHLEKDKIIEHQYVVMAWLKSQKVDEMNQVDMEAMYEHFQDVDKVSVEANIHESHKQDREGTNDYEEEEAICEQVDLAVTEEKTTIGQSIVKISLGIVMAIAIMILVTTSNLSQLETKVLTMEEIKGWFEEERVKVPVVLDNHLQPHLQYKVIDEHALKVFLVGRNSLLAQDPYFSSIMKAAQEFFINPLLMFAITGQEQGFVGEGHPRAEEIANNPFNVFGSWQDFNTNILETSRIAARTIVNLSKECPSDEDSIKWLNRQYAEDPNWHKGVTSIFNMLEKIAGNTR